MKLRPFRTSLVRLSLRRRSLTAIWVLIALAPVLALTAETARVTAAATAAESRQISKVRWALRLDPGNPAIHRQLGMLSYLAAVSLASPEKIPTDQIIGPLRKALQLNPYKPTYWFDLATVCDALHREDCAGPAFERALELDPLRPRFHWAIANYELRAGQTDRALTHFQQLLALDSAYAPETFHICVHVLGDPQVVWDRILPRENDELKLAYMNVLMQEGQANAAFQVWNRIAGGPSRFSFSAARPFLDELINRRLFVEAETVWLDLQKHGIVTLAGSDDRNGIFNGDFERFPLNAGFDWRYLEGPYVSLDFGATPAYRGSRCLRLEFTVSRNEEFEPVYQFVPVVPNRSYLLSAYVRSEGITSDSGPRLRVTDPACGGCLDASDDGTSGTTPWHPVRVLFSAGPSARVVRVAVWRPRGRTYPMSISGAFWLDSVSLQPYNSEHPESAPQA